MTKKKKLVHLFVVPIAMFGFGYLMVPIYDVFCKITGLNGKTGKINELLVSQIEVVPNRWIKVEFDSSLNQQAQWKFTPTVKSMMVNPGKAYSTQYIATNKINQEMVGQAIPSVAPSKAASYFNKTECFCFNQQKFAAFEEKQMPITFVVDPALPDDVSTVTLSYTFFDVNS